MSDYGTKENPTTKAGLPTDRAKGHESVRKDTKLSSDALLREALGWSDQVVSFLRNPWADRAPDELIEAVLALQDFADKMVIGPVSDDRSET